MSCHHDPSHAHRALSASPKSMLTATFETVLKEIAVTEEAELLSALIRHGCVNDGGPHVTEQPNADLLQTVLAGCGADIEMVDAAAGRRSLVARIPGTDREAPTLMLHAHTDVVPASPARWRHDPFGGELVDGFIWGRGALDMLGYAATMALAFRDHARGRTQHRGDVVFAAVADEEMLGALGTGWLLDNRPELLAADWMLTEGGGAPVSTSQGPGIVGSNAERGVWHIDITCHGAPSHAAWPDGTPTVTDLAAQACSRIASLTPEIQVTDPWITFVESTWPESAHRALTDPMRIDRAVDRLPDMARRVVRASTRMTLSVMAIETDGSWNTAPSLARLVVQARTLEGQDLRYVLSVLDEALGDLREQFDVSVHGGSDATATPTGTQLWLLAQTAVRAQEPDAALLPALATGATDARFFRHAGVDAYGVGLFSREFPAAELAAMMHGDDERIDLASLRMMRSLWSDILALHAEATRQ